MKRIQKISLLGAVGSSVLVADNVFNLSSIQANALTEDTNDQLQRQKVVGSLTSVLTLLLDQAPATDDSYVTQLNTRLTISAAAGVLSNDEAAAGDTASLVTDVQNGLLTLNADGSFDYLPNIDFNGSDTFTYRLNRSNGRTSEAIVTIRTNGTPDAIDDDFLIADTSVFTNNVIVNVVGGNDVIFDNAQVIEVTDQATALGGRISIQTNGDFEYTPPVNLGNQQDSFIYTLQDADGETDTATITWQIGPAISGVDQAKTLIENEVLDDQFTIFTPTALDYLELNGTQFSLTQLNSASLGAPLLISGEVYGVFSVIGFNASSGAVSYRFDPTGTAQDHMTASNNALRESIQIRLKDTNIAAATIANLDIDVIDTNPIANNDQRTISEGASAIAGNLVGIAGSATGDNQDTLIDANANPVTDIDFGNTGGTVGANISGSYGQFVVNSTGVYTYALDNTDVAVQGLKAGATLTDVFRYTITDGDGDTDSANLTITINGVEDARPTVTIPDANGAATGDISILEASTSPQMGQVTLMVDAGLAASGTALSITSGSPSVARMLSLAELNGLAMAPVTLVGEYGELSLTQLNASNGVLSYQYQVDSGAQDHSGGDDSIIDAFAFQATDNEGDQSLISSLDILVTDTNPVANNDAPSVTENGAALTGNAVFSTGATSGDVADTFTDTNTTPVTAVTFGMNQGAVGGGLSGQFGALSIAGSGVYTYTLDDTNAEVQALKTSDTLTDTFTYTIEDSDGDSDSADLIVTINGFDDPAPVITISDENASASGQTSIAQNQSGNFSNITLSANAGLANSGTALSIEHSGNTTSLSRSQLNDLTNNAVDISSANGTLRLTDFDAATGTLSYQFISRNGDFDHNATPEFVDAFSLTLFDIEGDASIATLSILIEDSIPTANNDTRSISEGTSAIAGNAVGIVGSATGDTQDDLGGDTTASPVTDIDFGATDGTVGTNLSSSYGSFVINSAGVYTYTLDNTSSAVQGLKTGQILLETFDYTVTDSDGSTDTASLQVTINGVSDPAPTLAFNTTNNQYIRAENSTFPISGQATITATAGLLSSGNTLSITPQGGSTTQFTLSQLQNLTTSNIIISGTHGTITLTAFNSSSGLLAFNYSVAGLPGSFDHSSDDPAQDFFTFVITDNEGDQASETIDFQITDTQPTAAPDTASIDENQAPVTVTGDVIVNDTQGADTAASVSQVAFVVSGGGAQPGTVGTPMMSSYGSMDINADGTYTYTLDNGNTEVDALNDGESLIEVFNYTIVDTDGDTSSTSVTVTINGVTDPI